MLDFSIGESVSFQPAGHPALTGIIAKYNRKTVTIVTGQGQQWNVSPALLRRVAPAASPGAGPVIDMIGG